MISSFRYLTIIQQRTLFFRKQTFKSSFFRRKRIRIGPVLETKTELIEENRYNEGHMKKKTKRLIHFLLRMDNFNRIMVFISMVIYLIVPSIMLYSMKSDNFSLSVITSCLCVLGMNIGIGLFTLYKPIRTTWYYFLSVLSTLINYRDIFLTSSGISYLEQHNLKGIYYTEIVFATICLIVNLIFFLKSFVRYQKSKTMTSEKTNADSPYDFVNGGEINHDIEKRIRTMDKDNDMLGRIKAVRFSRLLRILSFCLFTIVFLLYSMNIRFSTTSDASPLLLSALVLLPSAFFSSLSLPGDFKYVYYYVAVFYATLFIVSSSITGLSIFLSIVVLVVHILALLVTLITEGRTWTGNSIDQ